jgi:hypothetical protein
VVQSYTLRSARLGSAANCAVLISAFGSRIVFLDKRRDLTATPDYHDIANRRQARGDAVAISA